MNPVETQIYKNWKIEICPKKGKFAYHDYGPNGE